MKRPMGWGDQILDFTDWQAAAVAFWHDSAFHDLLILAGIIGLPVAIYYMYFTKIVYDVTQQGMYQLNMVHIPLGYFERFDWSEVKLNRDTDSKITEHFPDFKHMRQNIINPLHEDQSLKHVEYDNLLLSLEGKPEMDIYFGPRYFEEEVMGATYEPIGYESPDESEIRNTSVRIVNKDDLADSLVELYLNEHEKRLTPFWM